MAFGTSQFSGISSDYVRGIFNGTVNPPFAHPLDCVEAELLSFYSYVQNLTENVVPEKKAQVIPSSSKPIYFLLSKSFEFNFHLNFKSTRPHHVL